MNEKEAPPTPTIEEPLDEIIAGLVAARVAAVHTADEELEFADNAEIAVLANQLLDKYKAQAKEQITLLITKAEERGASKAAEVINKELGVEMTLYGAYYINNMRLATTQKEPNADN